MGLGGGLDGDHVGALLRLDELLVILDRELGVDRQPHRLAILAARQADGELDAVAALSAAWRRFRRTARR